MTSGLVERTFKTSELCFTRVKLEEDEEKLFQAGNFSAALLLNDLLFYTTMQIHARGKCSVPFEQNYLKDAIRRSFFYQAQLNSSVGKN